jgi:hypothetical protein
MAVSLAVEVYLLLLGLPLGANVLIWAVVHLLLAGAGGPPPHGGSTVRDPISSQIRVVSRHRVPLP